LSFKSDNVRKRVENICIKSYTDRRTRIGKSKIDGDFFKGAFTAVGNDFWAATIGMSVAREDTTTVKSLWFSDTLGYTKEDPLSKRPNLKTTISAFLEAHGYFRDYCDIHLSFENRWIEDKADPDANEYKYDPRISLIVSAHFCDFFWLFSKKK